MLSGRCPAAEGIGDRAGAHLAAVTSNVEGAARMGIEKAGSSGSETGSGTLLLGGPVGLAIALGSGGTAFRALLDGAGYGPFQTADAEANVPLQRSLKSGMSMRLG